jgi:hypothetical protein
MTTYLLAYHGGHMEQTPEAQQAAMAQWGAWFAGLGDAIVDGGAPVGAARTIATDGTTTDGGGTNPVSGYSLVKAGSLDDALVLAKGCPVLGVGGSIEVCETIEMCGAAPGAPAPARGPGPRPPLPPTAGRPPHCRRSPGAARTPTPTWRPAARPREEPP